MKLEFCNEPNTNSICTHVKRTAIAIARVFLFKRLCKQFLSHVHSQTREKRQISNVKAILCVCVFMVKTNNKVMECVQPVF